MSDENNLNLLITTTSKKTKKKMKIKRKIDFTEPVTENKRPKCIIEISSNDSSLTL